MMELMMYEKQHTRPPNREELVKAWRDFFKYKEEKKEPLVEYQARHALVNYRYLVKGDEKQEEISQDDPETLSLKDVRAALKALTRMPNDNRDTHRELARALYMDPRRQRQLPADVCYYVKVLSQTGDSLEARALVQTNFGGDERTNAPTALSQNFKRSWFAVLEGFSRENNEEGLLASAEMAQTAGLPYGSTFHSIMTTFFARRDQVEETKEWYNKPIAGDKGRLPETVSTILNFCTRNNELDWCKSVFRTLLERNPSKGTWDIIFQWAAGALGKGVEDVERMMEVMTGLNKHDENKVPDISTINGLVSLAMSRNDPYLAERYIALGLKHNIYPNAQTFILQLDYRVNADDLTGAQVVYNSLQSEEISDFADLPAINKYIRALCAVETPNYNLITSICSDLDQRKARLEPPTVAALGILYLDRNEIDELIDTLQAHAYHYSVTERASIRDAFLAYTLDPATPTARAWDSYTIFRQVFDETDIDIRTQAMNEFYRRGRSDMALHAFGHMRAHIRVDRRPVLSTYVDCLEGIARCADSESLHTVHNMLKMDSSIEPDTRLYNALMLAYTACEESDKAVQFWDLITNSSEGPSYRSIEIMFRACQQKPFGDRKAREIWAQMHRMEIEVTKNVFVAYIGALAGQGKLEDAKTLVESAEKDFGFKPDMQM
jgi:hypothetical protein